MAVDRGAEEPASVDRPGTTEDTAGENMGAADGRSCVEDSPCMPEANAYWAGLQNMEYLAAVEEEA